MTPTSYVSRFRYRMQLAPRSLERTGAVPQSAETYSRLANSGPGAGVLPSGLGPALGRLLAEYVLVADNQAAEHHAA